MTIALRGGTGRVVLVLAAATVAMARAKERKTLENDGKGRESTTRGTGQKASHAQTPTHAAHAAQHPHSQQRECEKRRNAPFSIREMFLLVVGLLLLLALFGDINNHISQEHPSSIAKQISDVPPFK